MKRALALLSCLLVIGCSSDYPKESLQVSDDVSTQRAAQTRLYAGVSEEVALSSSSQVLRDLGFTVEGGDSTVGLVAGWQNCDATENRQVAWANAALLLATISGQKSDAHQQIDRDQTVRAAIATRPSSDGKGVTVRATFQRVVRNGYQEISLLETLDDPELYLQFHEKLAKTVGKKGEQL